MNSTNQLVKAGDVDVQAGKTGFISRAGYCLATLLRLPQGGEEVAVVVLGARSNAARFWETRHLLNWFSTKAEDLLGARLEAAALGTRGCSLGGAVTAPCLLTGAPSVFQWVAPSALKCVPLSDRVARVPGSLHSLFHCSRSTSGRRLPGQW